jgi:hypothetical protein
MVHVTLLHALTKERVLPVLYSDNYFSMLPGELVSLRARVPASLISGTLPLVVVDTFNDVLA